MFFLEVMKKAEKMRTLDIGILRSCSEINESSISVLSLMMIQRENPVGEILSHLFIQTKDHFTNNFADAVCMIDHTMTYSNSLTTCCFQISVDLLLFYIV